VDRREIEAQARAEALVRDELDRRKSLDAEVGVLEASAGSARRALAALAGSRAAGLIAGYGTSRRRRRGASEVERRGAELRRRRFRLARRRRVLAAGVQDAPRPAAPGGPRWLADLDPTQLPARGPALRRSLLAGLIDGGRGGRPARPARVLVDPACPPGVAAAVAELGLERATGDGDADVAVAPCPGGLCVDWLLAGERSAARVDGLAERIAGAGAGAGASSGAEALAEALLATASAPSFCVRIAARDWEAANRGGDAALARSLARALGERGHQALLQTDAEAGSALGDCLDVLLVLRGRAAGEPTPGRLNLIWQISHPEETPVEELDRYDRVLVASRPYAEELRGRVRPPVEALLQFTDPLLFHPTKDPQHRHEVAFVGNWRGEFRRIVWDAIQAGHPPALYGRGWDLLAPEHFVAEHVPHSELHEIYASCDVLLCDHWDDMRRHGFVSNRVFDALACEAFVIADDNAAIAAELPGAVETYRDPLELRRKLDRYLADPDRRRATARRGRALVLAEHTVERRVERLLEIAAAALPRIRL
jgi:Glycosyl transferases group 1